MRRSYHGRASDYQCGIFRIRYINFRERDDPAPTNRLSMTNQLSTIILSTELQCLPRNNIYIVVDNTEPKLISLNSVFYIYILDTTCGQYIFVNYLIL